MGLSSYAPLLFILFLIFKSSATSNNPGAVEVLSLSELHECDVDLDCLAGRRCLSNRCEGFASQEQTFICSPSQPCLLSLRGYFETDASDDPSHYKIRLQTMDSDCGGSVPHKDVGDVMAVVVDQSLVLATLPKFPVDVVGRLKLCGCSNIGVMPGSRCSHPADFTVPLGALELYGDTKQSAASGHLLPGPSNDIIGQCTTGKTCQLQFSKSRFQDMSLKLISAHQKCGIPFSHSDSVDADAVDAESVLDDSRVPWSCSSEMGDICSVDVGSLKFSGAWRLCGCSNGHTGIDGRVAGGEECVTDIDFHINVGILLVTDAVSVFVSEDPASPAEHLPPPDLLPTVLPIGVKCDTPVEFEYDVTSDSDFDSLLYEDSFPLASLIEQADKILSPCFSSFSEPRLREKRMLLNHRRLQSADGILSDEVANRPDTQADSNRPSSPRGSQCIEDTDCLNRFGKCEEGRCRGFYPDLTDERLVRCVDGYRCDVKSGDIPGVDIRSDMQLIAISPSEKCGAVDPLKPTQSIFANSNRWQCEEDDSESCLFAAGVGMRRNKTATVEGVRLCGCPNVDGDGNGKACDNRREFFVPLGRLSVQECIRNAHCIDHQFAYCVYDHCAGASGVAASAGLKVFQCITSRNCDIKALTGKTVNEALKVLPIASGFNCGADAALDPDIIDDASLPCIVDINNDGVCEINLGIAKALGTTRLCGCSGDKGGNGRACDQLEDFDNELALVNVGECIVDIDCGNRGEVCIDGSCLSDTLPPYIVGAVPGNESYAVPPVNEVTLLWNENIQFTKAGRKLVIASTDTNSPLKWEMEVRDPSTYKIAEAGYSITIKGREMKIVPDIAMASFPEGKYVVGYEGGIVADLQENFNRGSIDIIFTVSKTAGCAYLYITGYSTKEVNPNGLYTPVEPINGHAAWRGGAHDPLFLYWKEKDVERNQPGNWIISSKTDEKHFIAYADLEMMSALGREGEVRPPGGAWKKWEGDVWVAHPEITAMCKQSLDGTFPKLIEIYPKIGGTSVETNNTRVMMRFSKPVTYGHWANLIFAARDVDHNITIIPDFEAGMRRKNIKSDLQGVVEVNLDGLGDLMPGTVYDLIGELGCLTDLAYNPWGPVGAGVLYFTTFGIPCSDFPDLGPAYQTEGSSSGHGDSYQVSCSEGYSSPVASEDEEEQTVQSTDQSRIVRCIDGSWEDIQLQCSADCSRFFEIGPQYIVKGDMGINHHGTVLTVTCAKETIVMEGTGEATTTCEDGAWSNLALKCGATCGAFPSLGSSYTVEYDSTSSLSASGSTVVGARRVVQCAGQAVAIAGTQPEYVVCEEAGWSTIKLKCHIACGPLPEYGAAYQFAEDDELSDQRRVVSCGEGYRPAGSVESTTVACTDGRWQQSEELTCWKNCGDFGQSAGLGYNVTPKSGIEGAHGSTIEISCREEAIQESGGASEVIKCVDGRWELDQLVCLAPCKRPEDDLGMSYVSEIANVEKTPSGDYPHGSTGYLYCAASSSIVAGIPPEFVICNNGRWIPAKSNEMVNHARNEQQARPTLVCQSSCGPFSKDMTRYKDVGNSDVNQQLVTRPASYGAERHITCVDGFSPEPSNLLEGLLTCDDGKWIESEEFNCLENCGTSSIQDLFDRGFDLVVPTKTSARHDEEFQVRCRNGLEVRVGEAETANVRCVNGHLDVPPFVCLSPSCSDGIKNGDEEAIDCGGSCLNACTACQLRAKRCTPTCRDGIQNGEEEGIDCGGRRCNECEFCHGLPAGISDGMMVGIVGNSTALSPAQGKDMDFIAHTRIDVLCTEGYTQISDVPTSRVQTFQCKGSPPKWELTDGSRSVVLRCGSPKCNDGIKNGDEFGVDCGGSCPNACISCTDGIKNGDEKSIDCGGTRCVPCANCGIGPFKPLNTKVVKVEHVTPASSEELSQLWDFAGTEHGSRRRVSCRDPDTAFSMLECDNGRWISVEGASSIHNLKCEGGSVDTDNMDTLASAQTQSFRIPSIPIPSDCSADSTTDCCQLVPEMHQFLASECGALLYGGKSTQLAGFCNGACLDRFQSILQAYKGREGAGCKSVPLFHEIKEVYCATGVQPPSSSSTAASSDQYYCFSGAGETLSQMKDLTLLRGGILTAACEANSCFATNLRYFELLRDLVFASQNSQRRNLRDSEEDAFEAAMASASASLTTLADRMVHAFSLAVLHEAPRNSTHAAASRRLAESAFLASSTSSSAVRQLLAENRYSRSLLNFMCLKDGDGNSCGHVVQRFASEDDAPAAAGSTAIIASSMAANPCADKCLLEVTRHLGQNLLSRGKQKIEPYMAMLGVLMRAYGRVACQKSTTGMSCGDLFSPNLVDAGPGAAGGITAALITEKKEKYPSCRCPIAYLADGRCDPECYTPDCAYDENDCLFENMFPAARQRLDTILPASDACHPFSVEFDCSSTGGSQCRNKVGEILDIDGCCAATRWEILREALNMEITLKLLANTQYEKATGKRTGEFFAQSSLDNKLVLDRSSSWIETTCQLSLDRGCSRGLRHSSVLLTLTLESLQHQRIFSSVDSSVLVPLLQFHLRNAFSDLLAVPIADIKEMRFWAGSILMEAVVDSGITTPSIMKDLKIVQENGDLQKAITAAVVSFLEGAMTANVPLSSIVDVAVAKKRRLAEAEDLSILNSLAKKDIMTDFEFQLQPVQFPPLSMVKAPPNPIVGTLDMADLSNSLIPPPCSTYLGLSAPSDYAVSENAIYVMDPGYGRGTSHGSTRQVHCGPGYEPSFVNSGPTPQFLQCDRGRWVTTIIGEKLLVCRRPCRPYEQLDVGFNPNEMSIASVGGQKDGATRVVTCLAGYHAVDGGKSPETLTCQNGAWDRRSLECTRGDGSNALLLSAGCGTLKVADFLLPNDVFTMKQIISGTVDANDFDSEIVSGKAPTKLTLWSVRCTRGYKPPAGRPEAVAMFCVNDTLIASTEFAVNDWELATPRGEASHEARAKDMHVEAKQAEIFHLFHSMADLPNVVEELKSGKSFDAIGCEADIRTPPRLASSQPGLPDAILYSILFGSVFAVIGLLMLLYYCKRTRCMKTPFFEQHHEDFDATEDPEDLHKDMKVMKKNRMLDLHRTADSSHPSSPAYTQNESDETPSVYSRQEGPGMRTLSSASRGKRQRQFEQRRPASASRYAIDSSARGSNERMRREASCDRPQSRGYVEQTIDRYGNDVRLSSNHRNMKRQVVAVHESTLSLQSPNPLPLDPRGRRVRKASLSQMSNSSGQWQDRDSDYDSSDLASAAHATMSAHMYGRSSSRLPQTLGKRPGAAALETEDEDVGMESSAIESGASFYSDFEIDPERLRELHLKFPERSQNMADSLKYWSQLRAGNDLVAASKDTYQPSSQGRPRARVPSDVQLASGSSISFRGEAVQQAVPRESLESPVTTSPNGHTPNNTPVMLDVEKKENTHKESECI